jgi:hypothetical protein
MQILMYSYNDWGGANNLLASYINSDTEHTARSITAERHPFGYDTDIVLNNATSAKIFEAKKLAETADFFVLGQLYRNSFTDILLKKIKPNNCAIFYGGSDVRPVANAFFDSHKHTKHIYTFARDDFTMIRCLPRASHHNVYMIDTDRWRPIRKKYNKNDPVKIFHSPTNQTIKGTSYILEAIKTLAKKYNVMWEHTGTSPSGKGGIPWAESMRKKAEADIYIDQLIIGAIGQNAAEAMTFGIPTMCYLSNHYMSMYPDTPIVNTSPDTILDDLEVLVSSHKKRTEIGEQTRKYCIELYGVHNSAWRWIHMIEFITGRA